MLAPKAIIVLVLLAMLVGFGYIVMTSYQTATAQEELRGAPREAPTRVLLTNQALKQAEKEMGD